ncbi:MAG: hypothetical protein HY438_01520 [DPANN group archaeon]|nr:hypothetical protein [DPANN group archaeon]
MKFKQKVLTIILILLTLYLIYQVWDWHALREEKWNSCEEIEKEIPELKFDTNINTIYSHKYERAWDSWQGCLGDYGNILMMYEIYKLLTIISIFLVLLSWRFDNLKNKE